MFNLASFTHPQILCTFMSFIHLFSYFEWCWLKKTIDDSHWLPYNEKKKSIFLHFGVNCPFNTYILYSQFSIAVLAPPRSVYFACLSLLTHLIQIISSLEVHFMHELCSDWHAPYTVSIAPYTVSIAPLSPSIGKSVYVYFTSEHSFMGLRYATSSRTGECDII